MLLIRPKKQEIVIKRKLIKMSAHLIAGRVEILLAVFTLPVVMLWNHIGFISAFKIAFENIKDIAFVIFIFVWIAKTFFNLGEKIKTE